VSGAVSSRRVVHAPWERWERRPLKIKPGWGFGGGLHSYYLFRPEGTFVYKTSPHPLRLVARELLGARKTKVKLSVFCGTWALRDGARPPPHLASSGVVGLLHVRTLTVCGSHGGGDAQMPH
jgi:hypothetical protein